MSLDTVTIVGAGGLGTPCAWGLLEGWRGSRPILLRIFDSDTVQLSNLHRQVLFQEKDIGAPKAHTLRAGLQELFPGAHIETEAVDITPENIAEKLEGSSFVVDATDSVATKFLLNDFCIVNKIPFCYGGAVGFAGQTLAVAANRGHGGCLRCLFGEFSGADMCELGPTCRQAGILGPVVGTLGFAQADYVLRFFNDPKFLSDASVLYRFDSERGRAEETLIASDELCPLMCGREDRRVLDLTEKKCPNTFLYTKLALEELKPGELLDVQFSSRESVDNVSRSVIEEGATPLSVRQIAASRWRVLIAAGEKQ